MEYSSYTGNYKSRAQKTVNANERILTIYRVMLRKNSKRHPIRTDRWRSILGVIVPLSPRNRWMIPKRVIRTAQPTRRPMTLADFHGKLFPPHWRAKRRQHTAPTSKAAPTISIFIIFVLRGRDLDTVYALFIFRVASNVKKTTPPMGKLLYKGLAGTVKRKASQLPYIQKHHLQVTSLVKAPPTTGPKHVAMPKALTTIPKYRGLLFKGAMYPMITRAPWNIPAEPTPAMARPTMKVGEFGAAAQSIDPTILS